MCDTVCVVGDGGSLFAKSSDRPVGEAQVVEVLPPRGAGGTVRTQYLDIADAGACTILGSRPSWLWGLEHGVNEHRVAIGNERLWTHDDLRDAPPGLIGMDLVRLGLERAHTASDAIDVMTELLERHGQGGPAEAPEGDPYPSSFLVADPTGAWVLETSDRRWAAKPVPPGQGAAISNRVTLRDDWTRASSDLQPATSIASWQDDRWAPIGDVRLACTIPSLPDLRDPRDAVALLRHHGERPWGRPGDDAADVSPVPEPRLGPDGAGVTVCMHVRDLQVTAASMVVDLPADPAAPLRAWAALGSPCTSVYLPLLPFGGVAAEIGDPSTWERFDALRRRAEAQPRALASIREVTSPVEAQLWDRADAVALDPTRHAGFAHEAWAMVDEALRALKT